MHTYNPPLSRLRQKLKGSLGYIIKHCLKQQEERRDEGRKKAKPWWLQTGLTNAKLAVGYSSIKCYHYQPAIALYECENTSTLEIP